MEGRAGGWSDYIIIISIIAITIIIITTLTIIIAITIKRRGRW